MRLFAYVYPVVNGEFLVRRTVAHRFAGMWCLSHFRKDARNKMEWETNRKQVGNTMEKIN